MQPGPELPAASVRHPRLSRRLVAHLRKPPSWAAGSARWALSAAAAAVLFHILNFLVRDGSLHILFEVGKRPGEIALSLFIFTLAMLPIFAMLRLSAALYYVLQRKRTVRSAVLWTAGFHVCAHAALLGFLRAEPLFAIHVPLLVGALWGIWLPRIHDAETYEERREGYLGTWMKS